MTFMWHHRNVLEWRHNGHDSVSNPQPHDCLLNRLFWHRSKKTSKFRVTGLCVGNSPGTGEFPAQMASYAENVSIWWRHHGKRWFCRHWVSPYFQPDPCHISLDKQASLPRHDHLFMEIHWALWFSLLCRKLMMLYCHLLELQAFFLYAVESQAWQRDACQIAWIVRFQFKQKLREFGRIATPKTSIESTTDEDIIFNDEKEKGRGVS